MDIPELPPNSKVIAVWRESKDCVFVLADTADTSEYYYSLFVWDGSSSEYQVIYQKPKLPLTNKL